MTDRDALLAAIAAAPHDDSPRLVYADWLDEQGESELAEFIRCQCELEPMRDQYEIDRAARLHQRERELWHVAQEQIDRALAPLPDFVQRVTEFTVRRGFLHSVSVIAYDYVRHFAYLHTDFPTVREVRLYRVNGSAAELCECAHLREVRELELACWYTREEAERLASGLHLPKLERLTVWMGGEQYDEGDDFAEPLAIPERDLVEQFCESSAWPHLRELVLYDVMIGTVLDAKQSKSLPKPERFTLTLKSPFPGCASLPADFPYCVPGKLPNGTRVVMRVLDEQLLRDACVHVIEFRADGAVDMQYNLPLTPDIEYYSINPESRAFRLAVHMAVGSQPAFIRVELFGWPDGEYPLYTSEYDVMDNPIGLVDEPLTEAARQLEPQIDVRGAAYELARWSERGEYWCAGMCFDKCGRIA